MISYRCCSVAIRMKVLWLDHNTHAISHCLMGWMSYIVDSENTAILIHLFTRWDNQHALEDIQMYRENLQNYINILHLSNASYHWYPKHLYNQYSPFFYRSGDNIFVFVIGFVDFQ